MSDCICTFYDDENKFSDEMTDILKAALSAAAKNLNPDFDISVIETAVGCEEIRCLNRETRNTDKVTDVLSFPMLEYREPCILKDKLMPWDFDPENNSVFLGDIVLCKEKIAEQAEEYGHSFLREGVYLTLHGLLHLFGYDHMTDGDKEVMREKEKEILSFLKI